jgi:hypothetical protein
MFLYIMYRVSYLMPTHQPHALVLTINSVSINIISSDI